MVLPLAHLKPELVFLGSQTQNGRRSQTQRTKKKCRRVYVGYRGKCDGLWLCIQSTLKREEKPGSAGPTKLPLASLQFCERTCYVIPQEPVFSYLTIPKTNTTGSSQKMHTPNDKNKTKKKKVVNVNLLSEM